MADREKVIYDIERCICHVPDACRDCSHYTGEVYDAMNCMEDLLAEACELLKAQDIPETNVGKWVSAKDRLPEDEGKTYLGIVTGEADRGDAIVHLDKAIEFVGWDRVSGFYLPDYFDEKIFVSYWMKISETPKEGT